MSSSESKDFCIDCGEPLDLYPTEQPRPPCPICGSIKRKRVVSVNEKIIVDKSKKFQSQIDRLTEIKKFYKGTKVDANLTKDIDNLESILKHLRNLLAHNVINLKDDVKISDKTIVEKTDSKQTDETNIPEKKIKEFSADVIISDQSKSKIAEGDKIVETSNSEIFDEVKQLRDENIDLHKSNSKISKLGIIGTIAGVALGLLGSYLITISTQPQIIIVNATSGTIMP